MVLCLDLALDAVDNSGETHLQVDHNIYKRRLNLDGVPISDPEKSDGNIFHFYLIDFLIFHNQWQQDRYCILHITH